MQGYASPQPVDRYGNVIGGASSGTLALQTTVSGTQLSSVITLLDTATTVEIVTTGGAAVIKWFGSVVASPSVTTANFDNAIPANWFRYLVIPTSIQGVASAGSIVGGFGAQNGLYKQIAVIPLQGAAQPTSIMVTQY